MSQLEELNRIIDLLNQADLLVIYADDQKIEVSEKLHRQLIEGLELLYDTIDGP